MGPREPAHRRPEPQTASVFPVRCNDGTVLPLLVVDDPADESGARVVPEVTSFLRNLTTNGESLSTTLGAANTLALFHDFVHIAKRNSTFCPERLAQFVAEFLRRRRHGSVTPDGLNWRPVQYETVKRDKYYLEQFSIHCEATFGHWPLVPMKSLEEFKRNHHSLADVLRIVSNRKRMLLGHIAGQMDWAKQKSEIELREKPVKRLTGKRTHMPYELIEKVINATPSIVQRMCFILAAFGGQRTSEILHLWRTDVLPGRFRPHLFPDDEPTNVPLVVLAHPSQSQYVGELDISGKDRLQYLAERYELTPRNLEDGKSRKSGWKGMDFDNDALHISQVFWIDRGWASIFFGLFQQLRDQVFSRMSPMLRNSHPYLIVNDSIIKEEFGQPMTISNLRKAFARACARAGVPHLYHRGLHGLRHSYKARCKELGLTSEETRKAMHHKSVDSQEGYGQSSAELNRRLVNNLGQGV